MPVYELVAAKGGLKIKEVPPPPPVVPGAPPPPRPAPGAPRPPGALIFRIGGGEITAMATTMPAIIKMMANEPEVAGRPIVDKTGFTGNFDVVGMTWTPSAPPAGMPPGPAGPSSQDAGGPSLFTALQETLGLKLVSVKAQVEVVVIDSIERPSEN